jgi:uncharacterized protein
MVSEEVVHRGESRRFEMDLGPDGVAYVLYKPLDDGVLDLRHTIVPEAAQGRGVGTTLIAGVFDIARREGIRLVPTCPFVAEWLGDHPEGEDVVAG